MQVDIRKIEQEDVTQLSSIAKQTFYDTFVNTCSVEDMNNFLEENYNVEKLLTEINNENYKYYFALIDNEVVGYLLFAETYEHFPEIKKWKALELKRIYVTQAYHGKGVAQTLMNFYLDYATINKYEVAWLGVWEFNEKAKGFYEKYGFVNSGYTHSFPIGNTPQTDIWLWKFLN